MAEGQGFEPWVPYGTTDFESVTFDLSDTPPEKDGLDCSGRNVLYIMQLKNSTLSLSATLFSAQF